MNKSQQIVQHTYNIAKEKLQNCQRINLVQAILQDLAKWVSFRFCFQYNLKISCKNHFRSLSKMPRKLSSEAKNRKKILFHIICKPRPQESGKKSNLCSRQKGWQITNHAWTHQHTSVGFLSRRRHADRSNTETFTKRQIWKNHSSYRCKVTICLS